MTQQNQPDDEPPAQNPGGWSQSEPSGYEPTT